jgi:hypothetical protein
MMQSIEEHQEIPKGEAAVMPAGGPRKRCRVENLAAECCQNRKERTQQNRESWRKLAAACRKVFCRAKVAWRKWKLIRRNGTQENCGLQKEFSPARIRMTHSMKMTPWKEHGLQRQVKDNSAPRTPTGPMSRMRCWIGPKCNNGIRYRDIKQKLQGSKQIKDLGGKLPQCPRNKRTSSWTYRKIIDSVKIAKQKARSYATSWRIKDWTLWRGRPPPKQKKKLHTEEEPVM